MQIRGVVLNGDPIFNDGAFAVYVGYIETENKKDDIPHYLVVNTKYGVVEGSSAQLFEARGQCSYFNSQMEAQDARITAKKPLFEAEDDAADAAVKGSTWN